MNREKMSKFIADYLQNDKTTFAMMLSGEWGTGKSYYIKGELSKEIKNNGNELMVISLYGMSSLQELSQRICYERNHTSLNAVKAIKATAKTIINYSPLPQIFWTGVGKVADKIKEKIDESVDLTGILLVLEDVERTKIDLEDFFGFVNNLCEQDGIKVLLVADEEKVREKLDNYDKIKDKAVGDTIHFEPDLKATLRNIFDIYDFNDVYDLKADMADIEHILKSSKPNFRKIIYVCRKVKQIFDSTKFKPYKDNKQFRKCIFLSTLSFVHGEKNSRYSWNNGKIYEYEKDFEQPKEVEKHYSLSLTLGDKLYPLPLFVYEYICEQKLEEKSIAKCKEKFEYYLKYVSDMNEIPSYNTLLYPCEHFDPDIERALNKAQEYISNKNNIINYTVLGTLLSRLAAIKIDLGIDTKECEEAILIKFAKENDQFPSEEHIFQFSGGLSEKAEKYLDGLIEQIMKSFESNQMTIRFRKSTGDIKEFFNTEYVDSKDFYAFIVSNEPKQFAEKIINSEPKTILNINRAFEIYFCEFAPKETMHTKLWLVKLKEELKKSVDSIQFKTVKHNIGVLLKTLEKAIEVTEAYLIENNKSSSVKEQ